MELISIVWYCFLATLMLETITFPGKAPIIENPEVTTPQEPKVDYDIRSSSKFHSPLIIEYW